MERLTTFQKEFSVDGFGDASSFRFLVSQFPDKTYKAECNSCKYYIAGKCCSASRVCTYERKDSLSKFYRV